MYSGKKCPEREHRRRFDRAGLRFAYCGAQGGKYERKDKLALPMYLRQGEDRYSSRPEKRRGLRAAAAGNMKRSVNSRYLGRRFGRLVALYPTERRDGRGSVYWRCRCDCGNTANITEASLTHGNARSCGCLKSGKSAKTSRTASCYRRNVY